MIRAQEVKSDTFTFHSPFTLSKRSGRSNKPRRFLVFSLNVPDFAHFGYVNCYLINFLQNLILPLIKTWKKNWKQIWTDKGQYNLGFFPVHFILGISIKLFKKYLILLYFNMYANWRQCNQTILAYKKSYKQR